MTPLPRITVWRFRDAPAFPQALSTNGGDEDWLVELPPGLQGYGLPAWIERMDCMCEPLSYPHPDKPDWSVIIGCHT